MKKIFRISDLVTLVLAFAMAFTVAGYSLTIAAGITSPNCTINQVINGQTISHPGCLKHPNVGWNS